MTLDKLLTLLFRTLNLSLYLGFVILPNVSLANPPSPSDSLWIQAQSMQLHGHPYWLRLLHYHQPFESPGQWSLKSDVQSPNFFLHPDGQTDPAQELKATLQAFFTQPGDNPNHHPQCRFIARYHWLQSQLNFTQKDLPKVTCPLFERWVNLQELSSISLVFVSAYMDNPASIYGHILMKINSKDRYFGHSLLSPTLNFGAIIEPDENPLNYVIKGLFGGYLGRFSDERFYNYNHLYGENELRDLWEYDLNLTKEQQKRIIYHAWELLHGIDFDYYFLLDNCAYRMGELLEMAWDTKKVNPQFGLWRIPIGVFHNINQLKNQGGPLIRNIKLIPSRQRRLQQKVSLLTATQKKHMLSILKDVSHTQSPTFSALSPKSQAQILDALIDYYQYQLTDNDESQLRKNKQHVLLLRSKLPALKSPSTPITDSPLPPTQGVPPDRIQLGIVHNPTTGEGLQVSLWSSYHDLLGREDGHLPNAQLVTLDLGIRTTNNDTAIEHFTFFDIQSIETAPTGLPGDVGWSWRTRGSLEREHLACFPCRVFHLSGGFGKAMSFTSQSVGYTFFEAFLQASDFKTSQSILGLSPSLGIISSPHRLWKFLLEGRYRHSITDSTLEEPLWRWEHRLTLTPNWETRFEWKYHREIEMMLALNVYW